jgi:hypothetical protein
MLHGCRCPLCVLPPRQRCCDARLRMGLRCEHTHRTHPRVLALV